MADELVNLWIDVMVLKVAADFRSIKRFKGTTGITGS